MPRLNHNKENDMGFSPHENTTQALAQHLVLQEIRNRVTQLIQHFAISPETLAGSDYNYEDDLMPILEKPDLSNVEIHSDSIEVDYCIALEHWIVSPWLGAQLFAMGEMVGELFGLHIWGRQTSGQAIYMDGVIQAIASSRQEAQDKPQDSNVDVELPF